ncbi:peptidase inhibitor family I36 protein [Micromonospora schwarzwaldensis]|uniref:peptidase inhibitor family I36 protein n=1 Tax=Micromonospora sp. DSM 45708 TaxID=3111767 RepID=UPI0031D7F1AF
MNRMKRIVFGWAAVPVLLTPLAVATPAQAAFSDCPSGRFCLFSAPRGAGVLASYSNGDANLGDGVGPQGMNNNTESMWNCTSDTWCVWDGTDYQGGLVALMPAGQKIDVMSTNTENRISSLKRC